MNLFLERSSGSQIISALAMGECQRAILVTGATENHGNHLPYGSDTLTPIALAMQLMERTDGSVLLPALPFGMSTAHSGFSLTISIRPEVLAELYFDIFDLLARSNIRSILVINGHDGNIISLRQAGYRLKQTHPQVRLFVFELWGVRLETIFGPEMGAGHAGETETSVLLNLHPELVNMKEAVGVRIPDDGLIWTNTFMHERSASGATGNPSNATSEHGRMAIKNAVDYLVDFLRMVDAS